MIALALAIVTGTLGFFAMAAFFASGRADDAMDRAFGDQPMLPDEFPPVHGYGDKA